MGIKNADTKYVRRSPAFREIGHCKYGESFWDGKEKAGFYWAGWGIFQKGFITCSLSIVFRMVYKYTLICLRQQ